MLSPQDFMFTYIPLFTNGENEPYIRSSNLLWDLALEESTDGRPRFEKRMLVRLFCPHRNLPSIKGQNL
jgi:hypothetical protein